MATIRAADAIDMPQLLSLADRFVAETELPLTFDLEASNEYMLGAIQNDDFIFLVEDDSDGLITGVVVGCVAKDYCKETCAYITKFFVEKPFRGLGTSYALLEAFQNEAKKKGASVIFASSTAGMGETIEKLYVRLLERHDYQVLGRVLVKEIP